DRPAAIARNAATARTASQDPRQAALTRDGPGGGEGQTEPWPGTGRLPLNDGPLRLRWLHGRSGHMAVPFCYWPGAYDGLLGHLRRRGGLALRACAAPILTLADASGAWPWEGGPYSSSGLGCGRRPAAGTRRPGGGQPPRNRRARYAR